MFLCLPNRSTLKRCVLVAALSFGGFHKAILNELTCSAYVRMYRILDLLGVAGFEGLDQHLMLVEDLVPAFALQDLTCLAFPGRMNVPMHPLTRVLDHGCPRSVAIRYRDENRGPPQERTLRVVELRLAQLLASHR